MGFRENLTAICSQLPDTRIVTLMDHDGIPIDTVTAHDPEIDVETYLVEIKAVFDQAMRSSTELATGEVSELIIRSHKLITLLRPLNSEYFLVLGMAPEGNAGKARYLLRLMTPRFLHELG